MKKKLILTFPLLVFLALDIAANVLIFALVPEEMRTANFWITWVFAAPLGWLAMFGVINYVSSNRVTFQLVATQHLNRTCILFEGFYTALFLLATFAFRDKLTVVTLCLEAAITVIYGLTLMKQLFPVELLRQTDIQQAAIIEEKKSRYIPELDSMLGSALAVTTEPKLRAALMTLQQQVLSSEPMSPPQAATAEDALRASVYKLTQLVLLQEYEDFDNLVRDATLKLMERNRQCQLYRK